MPLLTAQFQQSPGYMDAEYYYAGGLELASGRGFTEPFIWNYLDDPVSVPRPSHAYWMPLASLLAAAGMVMSGSTTFAASRIFFLLLAGLIPVATAALSWELYHQRAMALMAGALALLPGFYLPYLATSDTFAIFMLLGVVWLLLIGRIVHKRQVDRVKWLLILGLGMTAGLMHLARADGSPQRFYSLSAQIQRDRKDYYEVLERTQKGTLDVTGWLSWFLGTLARALASAQTTLDAVLVKARFWQRWAGTPLNERQVNLLNRLLDGFEGKLTSSKWAAIAKCSPDTALRDITQLLELGVLKKSPGGGRSTSYALTNQ